MSYNANIYLTLDGKNNLTNEQKISIEQLLINTCDYDDGDDIKISDVDAWSTIELFKKSSSFSPSDLGQISLVLEDVKLYAEIENTSTGDRDNVSYMMALNGNVKVVYEQSSVYPLGLISLFQALSL